MEGIEAEREGKEFEEARAREKSRRTKVKGVCCGRQRLM